jgi:hypothetical protein
VKTKILHVEVNGCHNCPAYLFCGENEGNSATHNCGMGACNFPQTGSFSMMNKPVPEGYFASDCPLQEKDK